MYRLTVDGVQYYFVAMRNVFSSHLNIHRFVMPKYYTVEIFVPKKKIFFRKFDLKGSTVDREASDKELEKSLPTLKDNDFIKQKIRIFIGDIAKTKFMEMMNADVNVTKNNFFFLFLSIVTKNVNFYFLNSSS